MRVARRAVVWGAIRRGCESDGECGARWEAGGGRRRPFPGGACFPNRWPVRRNRSRGGGGWVCRHGTRTADRRPAPPPLVPTAPVDTRRPSRSAVAPRPPSPTPPPCSSSTSSSPHPCPPRYLDHPDETSSAGAWLGVAFARRLAPGGGRWRSRRCRASRTDDGGGNAGGGVFWGWVAGHGSSLINSQDGRGGGCQPRFPDDAFGGVAGGEGCWAGWKSTVGSVDAHVR